MTANEIQHTHVVRGRVTPAFIHNGSFFFVNLPVYENGLVDCWEALDVALFAEKLKAGWVVPAVPNGDAVHVDGLGAWRVSDGRWQLDSEGLRQRVLDLVRELNPELHNLYDCHGVTSRLFGRVRVSILGSWTGQPVRFDEPGFPWSEPRRGQSQSIWYSVDGVTLLADLRTFADGKVELGRVPSPQLWTPQQLEQAFDDGRLLTHPPLGARVQIHELGSFIPDEELCAVEPREVLREVADIVERLNGRPTSIARCMKAFAAYQRAPSEETREALRIAYEAIPEHNRIFAGDQDTKDIPIRMVLYGDAEIEKWSHRIASREAGLPLPNVVVPRPKKPDGQ